MHLSERHVYLTLQDELRRGSDKRFLAYVESVRKEGSGWRLDGLGGGWHEVACFRCTQRKHAPPAEGGRYEPAR